MRTHGWNGNRPANDDDARARILDAAARCVDRYGDRTTLTDVAKELGVTRQTVYRYFPGTVELLRAMSIANAGEYLDRMVADLSRLHDPTELVIESILYSLEHLPGERHLTLVAAGGHHGAFIEGITSSTAIQFAGAVLRRLDIDWRHLGIQSEEIDELAELAMRLIQSFLINPGDPPRGTPELRLFLHRWIAPALAPRAPTAAITVPPRNRARQSRQGANARILDHELNQPQTN